VTINLFILEIDCK